MWTPITRCQHSRKDLHYGSDLTDAEWEIIALFLLPPRKARRPRCWPVREVMDAIFYVLRSGCPWRTEALLYAAFVMLLTRRLARPA